MFDTIVSILLEFIGLGFVVLGAEILFFGFVALVWSVKGCFEMFREDKDDEKACD